LRVGSGNLINIWEYHWIPLSPDRMIQTSKGQVLLRTVNELIDPSTWTCDEDLVRSIFNPIDVGRILQIS
jgi:hypothetical protein